MRRSTLLVGLACISACSGNDDVDTVYDPCSPLAIAVLGDHGDAEVAGVESAIAAWARVLPTQITIGATPGAADALPIRFESGESFYRAIYWDAVGEISVSRDRLDPDDYALAIAHEMGHAFGLLHVDKSDRASVMNVGNLEIVPNDEDAAAVRALWDTCSVAAE